MTREERLAAGWQERFALKHVNPAVDNGWLGADANWGPKSDRILLDWVDAVHHASSPMRRIVTVWTRKRSREWRTGVPPVGSTIEIRAKVLRCGQVIYSIEVDSGDALSLSLDESTKWRPCK